MRVLHLIDAASPQSRPTTLALMASSLGRLGEVDQAVALLGGRPLADAARAAGVRGAQVIGVPFGRAVLGWPAVRRYMRGAGPFDLIHCWSVGALSLAALAFRGLPKALTLTTPVSERATAWLRVLSRESAAAGGLVVLPISATLRRALLSAGVAEAVVHVLRPGIDLGRVGHSQRAAIRKGWGVESDSQRVAAIACDPVERGDALAAAMGVLVANEITSAAGRSLRLLLHPQQLNRVRVRGIARNIDKAGAIIDEPRVAEPWSVLPGCDLVLALGPYAGGLSLLWAMAANVPIVGEASYAVSEIVEDRHSALLVKESSPKQLAKRITQLVDDPRLAWRLRDTARHEAYSFFSRQRYCQSLQAVYGQVVAGEPISVPAVEATGGLRFAGRA